MGDPSNVAQVTVTATYRLRLSDGTTVPATGYVTFTPTTRLQDGGSSEILPVAPVRAVLDSGGHISVTLMATDDPDLAPTGWGYEITTNVGGTSDSYFAVFPAAIPTVDLSTVAPASVTPLVGYVALSAVGAPTGVASLDSGGQVPLSQLGNAPSGGGTPSGTVSSSAVGDAGAAGASANYSRGDHVHGREGYGAVVSSTSFGQAPANGVATTDARSDHVHGTPAAPTPGSIGAQPVDATLTALAGLDATAGLVVETAADTFTKRTLTAGSAAIAVSNGSGAAGNPTVDLTFGGAPAATEGIGTAGAAGTAASASHSDHVHPMAAAGAPGASAVGDTQSTGVATTFAASDHRHARESFGNVVAQTAYGASSTNGVATTDARSDHAHGTPAVPPAVTTPNLISGAWYAVPGQGGVGTTVALAAGTALFIALTPELAATLSGLAVEITTTDSGNVRFGLATETAGLPAAWLDDYGVVTAGSLGLVQPASTPSRSLAALGRVWIGIVPQGGAGALVLRNRSTCSPDIALTTVSTATPGALNSARNAYTSTGWTAALTGAITIAGVTSGPAVAARLT